MLGERRMVGCHEKRDSEKTVPGLTNLTEKARMGGRETGKSVKQESGQRRAQRELKPLSRTGQWQKQ